MAKATTIKVKLVSSADTGFYYVTRKNSRTMTDKLVKKKYDPVAKKHVEFREVEDQVTFAADQKYGRPRGAPIAFAYSLRSDCRLRTGIARKGGRSGAVS